jgi:hypothetical protein
MGALDNAGELDLSLTFYQWMLALRPKEVNLFVQVVLVAQTDLEFSPVPQNSEREWSQ